MLLEFEIALCFAPLADLGKGRLQGYLIVYCSFVLPEWVYFWAYLSGDILQLGFFLFGHYFSFANGRVGL